MSQRRAGLKALKFRVPPFRTLSNPLSLFLSVGWEEILEKCQAAASAPASQRNNRAEQQAHPTQFFRRNDDTHRSGSAYLRNLS